MVQWCLLPSQLWLFMLILSYLYTPWITNLTIFVIIMDKWSLFCDFVILIIIKCFCLCNCEPLKMKWKNQDIFSHSNHLNPFSISLPLLSFFPSFSHASTFSFTKFRTSVRSWPLLSMSSIRNNSAMMKGRSRPWCLINLFAEAPPNLMDFNLCATLYALLLSSH